MTKSNNIIVFESELYGTVRLVKKSISVRETYYKGQLVDDWYPMVVNDLGSLDYFVFSKGQVIWLSKEYFSIKPV